MIDGSRQDRDPYADSGPVMLSPQLAMSTRAKRIQELFERALERSVDERSAFLKTECGDDPELRAEVATLLSSLEQAEGFLDDTPTRGLGDEERQGAVIDRYKLLEVIGEGGFGVVWVAEQSTPVRRRVALKIIKLGMDTREVVARFEAERQALALMDHPGIAKVLDGGATGSGRPYFVMELVRGVPVTEFCDRENLELADRLRLMQQICDAVQHAHQKGVIHRDLKPGNILVSTIDGRPAPKVIDFGIAKAMNQALTQRTLFTARRQLLGTPEYMAPEQAGMTGLDVDTRADVYSLGVVLYEILTSTKPFDFESMQGHGYDEMFRRIREVDPPKPSTRVSTLGEDLATVAKRRRIEPRRLGRSMRGELDWVVMRALEKEPDRRYPTASALAEDLRRYLAHEPVEAGPPGAGYRLIKFARRNRGLVTAVAVVILALLAGVIGTGLALQRALKAESDERAARQRAENDRAFAEEQSEVARSVMKVTQEMLGAADPRTTRGPDYTVRELLDDFDADLGDRLAEQPAAEAAIRTTMGSAYRSLGMIEPAGDNLDRALSLLRDREDTNPLDLAAAVEARGWVLHDRGDYEAARSAMVEAHELTQQGDAAVEAAARLAAVAEMDRRAGRYRRSEQLARQAVEELRAVPDGSMSLPVALEVLGLSLEAQGRAPEAEEPLREALMLRRGRSGRRTLVVASAMSNLAASLDRQGRYEEAATLYLDALAIEREHLPDEHLRLIAGLNNAASIVERLNRLDEAEALYREALALARKKLGDEHPNVALTKGNLATVMTRLGKFDESERLLREALPVLRKRLGADHPHVATTLDMLGGVLRLRGKLPEAERVFREELELRRAAPVQASDDIAQCLSGLARVIAEQKRYDEAETMMREALDVLGDQRATHPFVAAILYQLATVVAKQGRRGEQAEILERMIAVQREAGRGRTPDTAMALERLGVSRLLQKQFAEAEVALRESLELRADDPMQQRSLQALIRLYDDWSSTDPEKSGEAARYRDQLRRLRTKKE